MAQLMEHMKKDHEREIALFFLNFFMAAWKACIFGLSLAKAFGAAFSIIFMRLAFNLAIAFFAVVLVIRISASFFSFCLLAILERKRDLVDDLSILRRLWAFESCFSTSLNALVGCVEPSFLAAFLKMFRALFTALLALAKFL